MQFQTVLAFLLPAIATVNADCFTTGPSWNPNREMAKGWARDVCNDGRVSGNFASGQEKVACIQMRDQTMAVFKVRWLGAGNRFIDATDCGNRLFNEVNGCEKGGASTVDRIRFVYVFSPISNAAWR